MISIQKLSQDVGIGVDTLRIWERRYGFPQPQRDQRGHRTYSDAQLAQLRIVRKLQDLGQRPGTIFALNPNQRQDLLQTLIKDQIPLADDIRKLAIDMPVVDIAPELRKLLGEKGLVRFIHENVLPLLQILGLGWSDGSISIAREHFISDLLEDILKQAMKDQKQSVKSPRILFLTLSGERHRIGLLMAAALFQQQGATCLLIQEDLPPSEVPPLARELKIDAVAISFSPHFPAAQAKKELVDLRRILPAQIKLIAGGQAIDTSPYMPGIRICTDLTHIPDLFHKEFGDRTLKET
jgi:DNA-binding transcriptional MerR regulator